MYQDIERTDTAADGQVLSWCLDDGVTEEEDSCDDSSDGHGISATEELNFSQTSCDKRTKDGADVGDGVVAPCLGEGGCIIGKTAAQERSVHVSLEYLDV